MTTQNKKYSYNREQLLLFTLTALAFWGFLLWNIEQAGNENASLLTSLVQVASPATNKSFRLFLPKPGSSIKSPVKISGQILSARANVYVRIKDASGLILKQSEIKEKTGDFSDKITYKKPTRLKGVMEIFSLSPKNSSEIDKITISVIFKD